VADCTGLVTFNGRSFDMPLLATRYTVNRLPAPLPGVPHLDLLPPARRLWRRRLASCALTSLEAGLLGFERQDDVPGWLIPHRYFRFQRDGDARGLVGIFEHNVLDILTMVSLLTRMDRAYGRPVGHVRHGPDWLSLARAYDAARDQARVVDACRQALAGPLTPDEADEAHRRLSLAAKRAGDWPTAVATWHELVDGAPRRLFPFEELAKYYEHRAGDLGRALGLARRARDLVAGGALRTRRRRSVALAELDYRIARLERRRARAADGG
jgi:hypothetical protein